MRIFMANLRPRHRVSQQLHESGLLKMVIGSERLLDLLLAHHHETNTVREPSLFVRALAVERPSVGEQSRTHWDNQQTAIAPKIIDK
jgi:hypothetical protein